MSDHFSVKFWGVRGSIACPGDKTKKYGGNTSCLEVRCGDDVLIFDAGTGIRNLGHALLAEGKYNIDLFFTHLHLDHICGLPFFPHAFKKEGDLRFWAGHLLPDRCLKDLISTLIIPPFFPVPVELFTAKIEYNDFEYGQTLQPRDGVVLKTVPLNHPDGAVGYRIEYGGRSICYITDTEHVPGKPDEKILSFIQGADIVVYDSTYTDEEWPLYKGWGHSTWQEGVRLCEQANVGKLVIFHHDPSHDDDFMDEVARQAEEMREGTVVAREGMMLEI